MLTGCVVCASDAGGNLLIACLTSLGYSGCNAAGRRAGTADPADTANALGCMLLVLMGLWMLYREAQGGMGAPEQPPADACGTRLGLRESAALAAALMVNNMGFGVGARITGLSIVKTTACTFVCSLILLAGGAAVGRRFGGGHLGRYAGVCSAALIVALGVYELFI